MSYAFSYAGHMAYEATDVPDLSNVSDMSYMFFANYALNGDLSGWDTSHVTNMKNMFAYASIFNGDISSWDVSNVEDMSNMFDSADMFNQPIGGWNTNSLQNMQQMFKRASKFNQNINDWDVSSVTNMSEAFSYAREFNQPLNSWDVSNVTSTAYMFEAAHQFNQPLDQWNTSSLVSIAGMFNAATGFKQSIANWNTSNVTNMSSLFYNAGPVNQDLSGWDVSQVIYMGGMFTGSSLPISTYDNILNSWASQNVQSGVNFGAGSSKYSAVGSPGRSYLTSQKGWTISDGGEYVPFSIDSVDPNEVNVDGPIEQINIYGSNLPNSPSQISSIDISGVGLASMAGYGQGFIIVNVPTGDITSDITSDVTITDINGVSQTLYDAVTFRVAPLEISSVSPTELSLSDSSAQIQIFGSGFVSGATVKLGDIEVGSAGFYDSGHLSADIYLSDLNFSGVREFDVTVTNPNSVSKTLPGAVTIFGRESPAISSVSFEKRGDMKLMVIDGQKFVSGDNGVFGLMGSRSLVSINGNPLPACSKGIEGLDAAALVVMGAFSNSSLVSDEAPCYLFASWTQEQQQNNEEPTPLLTPTQALVWLPDDFDESNSGVVSVNDSPDFTFDGVQPVDPSEPSDPTNPSKPNHQKRPRKSGDSKLFSKHVYNQKWVAASSSSFADKQRAAQDSEKIDKLLPAKPQVAKENETSEDGFPAKTIFVALAGGLILIGREVYARNRRN